MRTKILAALSLLLSAAGVVEVVTPGTVRLLPALAPIQWLKSLYFLAMARPLELPAPPDALGVCLALFSGPTAVLCIAGIFKAIEKATPNSVMARKSLQVSIGLSLAVMMNYAFYMQHQHPDLLELSPDLSAGIGYAVLLAATAVPLTAAMMALLVEGVTNPERGLR